MIGRLPLVLSGSQVEQLPNEDFIQLGKLNLGTPKSIVVTSNTIQVSKSYVQISAVNKATVTQIDGGTDGDILLIQGGLVTAKITIDYGGNILPSKKRNIQEQTNILLLLRTVGQWYEISWSG